jgi:hypothetical protein
MRYAYPPYNKLRFLILSKELHALFKFFGLIEVQTEIFSLKMSLSIFRGICRCHGLFKFFSLKILDAHSLSQRVC